MAYPKECAVGAPKVIVEKLISPMTFSDLAVLLVLLMVVACSNRFVVAWANASDFFFALLLKGHSYPTESSPEEANLGPGNDVNSARNRRMNAPKAKVRVSHLKMNRCAKFQVHLEVVANNK